MLCCFRLLREAEAELAAKKRDHDKLRPKVEQFGETLPGLESDYERRRKYEPFLFVCLHFSILHCLVLYVHLAQHKVSVVGHSCSARL